METQPCRLHCQLPIAEPPGCNAVLSWGHPSLPGTAPACHPTSSAPDKQPTSGYQPKRYPAKATRTRQTTTRTAYFQRMPHRPLNDTSRTENAATTVRCPLPMRAQPHSAGSSLPLLLSLIRPSRQVPAVPHHFSTNDAHPIHSPNQPCHFSIPDFDEMRGMARTINMVGNSGRNG
jgi:hypothetical protein